MGAFLFDRQEPVVCPAEVIKVTPIQAADFDAKAFRLLDALNDKGRVAEASLAALSEQI